MIKYVDIYDKDKVNDECGVFGVYKAGSDDFNIASLTREALYGLQHRGQVSAGITVNNNGNFTTVKEFGMVSEVFNDKAIDKLGDGNIAVGHVRYSAHESLDRAANQPLVMRYIAGSLAIASNGAITNFAEIRQQLEHGGAIFQSNSNVEIMSYVIATERCTTDDLETAVLFAMDKLEGAYSAVLCGPSRLIGFRDKNGFRPLCIGKLNNSYIITSESCVIDSLGGEFLRDVEPGEMVVIDETGFHSYKSRIKAGELLYNEHPIDADMVCGVPDSGIIAAQGYAKASGIPYGTGFVKNKYIGRTVGTGKDKKKRLLKTRLTALKANVSGKRIIIVDDSIVRGETANHIVKLLRDAGAKEVHMLISSPPFVCPCYFGMDIHNKESLIANRFSQEEICNKIGADSLGYLSVSGLNQIAEGADVGFCNGCFTGEYPAEIPRTIFVDKFAKKINKK